MQTEIAFIFHHVGLYFDFDFTGIIYCQSCQILSANIKKTPKILLTNNCLPIKKK